MASHHGDLAQHTLPLSTHPSTYLLMDNMERDLTRFTVRCAGKYYLTEGEDTGKVPTGVREGAGGLSLGPLHDFSLPIHSPVGRKGK